MADRWWVIHEDALVQGLVDAHQGMHPDLVFVELLAAAEVEPVPPDSVR